MWGRPVSNSGYLCWIRLDAIGTHYVAHKSEFWFVELTLLQLAEQVLFFEYLQYCFNVLQMLCLVFAEDDNIIQVYYHKGQMFKQTVHAMLESSRRIGQAKGHDKKLIMFPTCCEGGFRHIIIMDAYLMISRSQVQGGKKV